DPTSRLKLFFQGQTVADLDMKFLHDGRPDVVRRAIWQAVTVGPPPGPGAKDCNQVLRQILGAWNVCSKEWIIRQYDHEVQGGSVIKPLVGVANDGPSDASVILPLQSARDGNSAMAHVGLAVGSGINPKYGDIDPYAMAAAAI